MAYKGDCYMCAARVEVRSDQVKVKDHDEKVVGEGRGVYRLRDYDAQVDALGEKPARPPGSMSGLLLELGDDVGSAYVRTRKHDTTIELDVVIHTAGLQGIGMIRTAAKIFDDTYGHGKPEQYDIVSAAGMVLATVTHLTRKNR